MNKLFSLCLCLLGFSVGAQSQNITARVVDSGFIYQQEPYPSCHASTIVETPDGYVAAWFGGTYEKYTDVCIYSARFENGKWSKPKMVADGVEPKYLTKNPCWNPVLFRRDNGDVLLYYKVGPCYTKWFGMYLLSTDNGKTWSEPKRIPNNLFGPIKNKPFRTTTGDILYPTSIEDDLGWRVYMESSKQDLSNWHRIDIDNGKFNAIQPTILDLGKGQLQILCRTKDSVIVTSKSKDNGKTWSKLSATNLPNPNSGIDAVTLKHHKLHVLVYNPDKKGRKKLVVAVSKDAIHWNNVLTLEDQKKNQYSYPAVIERSDGKLFITYTYRREHIKYAIVELN